MKKSIKQQIEKLPKHQQALVPEIKVEIEPVFEVTTPAPDMAQFSEALKQLMIPKPEVNVHAHINEDRKLKRIKIDVERDGRGFIKSLMCTELTDG